MNLVLIYLFSEGNRGVSRIVQSFMVHREQLSESAQWSLSSTEGSMS
jgi:hypothetical protein